MKFTQKTYTYKNLPKKRKLMRERCREIYPTLSLNRIDHILDNIKIVFRKQKEKGASNHENKTIYISLNELKKYGIDDETKFVTYLESPYSPISHETTHIFQNLFKAFPHVQYTEKKPGGGYKIDYEKYVSDEGEIQARLEHIRELLKWGFTKDEIIEFLYSRKHNDKKRWGEMVDKAKEMIREGK